MELDTEPASVGAARRWVADAMGPADPDVVDRALLCASELVTNAIEHAHPPAGVRVAVGHLRIRIEVDDSSELLPHVGDPAPTSIRGRGLLIVRRCSDRWGIVRRPGGKTVWCELRLNDAE